MNSVTMTGRLTKEPKLKHAGERAICQLRIAVDNGRHPSTYIDVDTFDASAYACAEYLSKGRRVGVSGMLALDEWRDAQGRPRRLYKVIGRVEFLDPPPRPAVDEAPIGPPAEDPQPSLAEQPEMALAA
jgi:single-strand DNA-binding protein